MIDYSAGATEREGYCVSRSARVTYLRLRYTAAGRGNYLGSDSAAVCLSVCLSLSLTRLRLWMFLNFEINTEVDQLKLTHVTIRVKIQSL